MNQSNILSIKLKFLYVFEFAAMACFYPFLTYYFQNKGFSYTQIGIAMAVYSITGVITQPIWGVITDKYLNKRTSILITMVFSSLIVYLFIFVNGFYSILISMILLLMFQSSVNPLSDAYSYEIIDHNKDIQYGKVRLMGSFGYAVAALTIAQAVKYTSINSSFVLFSITMLLGAIIVWSINFKSKSHHSKVDFSAIKSLMKDNRFSIFIISVIIVNISFGINGSYITVLIQKTGGDVSKLGILWFVLAISELPTLFLGNKLLNKFGELNLLMIGLIFYVLRYFLDSLSTSYISVIMIQGMQSITYPLFLISSYQYMNKITPAKMKSSVMTFFAAACGIGNFIGNIGGGILLEHISVFLLFRIISFICVICLIIIVILKRINIPTEEEVYINI